MKKFLKKIKRGLCWGAVIGAVIWSFSPVHIDVPDIRQLPDLPNGCEATSLAMVLHHSGYDVSPQQLANDFLPKGPIGHTSPARAYVGDPAGQGFYCYPGPLVKAANRYFENVGSTERAKTPMVMEWFRMSYELHRGRPVIAWVTLDDKWPEKINEMRWDVDGRTIYPYKNLHVVVVNGVDWGRVQVMDPLQGSRELLWPQFMLMYVGMGMKSVLV